MTAIQVPRKLLMQLHNELVFYVASYGATNAGQLLLKDVKALLNAPKVEPTCNCSMPIKLVGDGCAVCNPEHWSEETRCQRCGISSDSGLSLCAQCNKD